MEKDKEIIPPIVPVSPVKQNAWTAFFDRIPKKMILLISATLMIILFFLLPANKLWFKEKVIGYWNDFIVQRKQLSIEQRNIKRFGTEYSYSKEITRFFEQKGIAPDVLVLVPSEAYFKKQGIVYPVPEPVTFYYLTGLKIAWPKDKKAVTANWYVTVRNNKLYMDSVTGIEALTDTITAFKKY